MGIFWVLVGFFLVVLWFRLLVCRVCVVLRWLWFFLGSLWFGLVQLFRVVLGFFWCWFRCLFLRVLLCCLFYVFRRSRLVVFLCLLVRVCMFFLVLMRLLWTTSLGFLVGGWCGCLFWLWLSMVAAGFGLCCLLCIWLGVVRRVVVVCRGVLASWVFCSGFGLFRCVFGMGVL